MIGAVLGLIMIVLSSIVLFGIKRGMSQADAKDWFDSQLISYLLDFSLFQIIRSHFLWFSLIAAYSMHKNEANTFILDVLMFFLDYI